MIDLVGSSLRAAPSPPRRRVAVWVAAAIGIALCATALTLRDEQATQTSVLPVEAQQQVDNLGELERHLQRNPGDARAWAIYARVRAERGEFAVAESAYAQAVAARGRVALDPAIWCEYAETVAMGNGGRLAGRPETLIARALQLNPRHPRALEMAGSAAIEQERYVEALQHWEQLLELLPVDTPQHAELLSAIERLRLRVGRP